MTPRIVWLASVVLIVPQASRAQEAAQAELITKEARQAIDGGLTFLAKNQADDGSWGTGALRGNVAVTGLSGLAFLRNGQQPGRGVHGAVLTKAVGFVLSKEDQGRPGYLGGGGAVHGPMYVHGFGTLFLAAALQAAPDQQLKDRIKPILTRAVKVILDAQNNAGGWRYQPTPLDADISVTACQLHALLAARDAGFDVPQEALDKAAEFVVSCRMPDGGGFRYLPQGGPPGFARTAAATSALQRVDKKDGLDKSLKYLKAAKGIAGLTHYYYGHYYATQALARVGGDEWKEWYTAVRDEVLGKRNASDGSWPNLQVDGHYCTAMAILILEAPLKR